MQQRILRYVIAVACVVVAWTGAPEPVGAYQTCAILEMQCDIPQGTLYYHPEWDYCGSETVIEFVACFVPDIMTGEQYFAQWCDSEDPCYE